MEFPAKVKSDSAKGACGFGGTDRPLSDDIFLGFVDGGLSDREMPKGGEIGGWNVGARRTRLVLGPLHVGLSGTNPHFPNQNVLHLERVFAGDGHFHRLCGGSKFKLRGPFSVLPSRGCCRLGSNGDRYFFVRIGPPPNGGGFSGLKNHVIAQNLWESYVCKCAGGEGDGGA